MATSIDVLLQNLENLQKELANKPALQSFSRKNLEHWQTEQQSDDFVACILGHTWDELNREIEFAIKGNTRLRLKRKANGEHRWEAFLHPIRWEKAVQSHLFIRAHLIHILVLAVIYFFCFRHFMTDLAEISKNLSDLLNEKMLYPRSISALSNCRFGRSGKKIGC